jgi:hypothetical protein
MYHFDMTQNNLRNLSYLRSVVFCSHSSLTTVFYADSVSFVSIYEPYPYQQIFFCSVPDSSDDDHSGSSHEGAHLTTVNQTPRRIRSRLPSVPVSFCSQRKYLGKKRSRRYDNG